MSNKPARSEWMEARLRTRDDATERSGWECRKCGLLVSGAPVRQRPARCPVCIAREGKVVALIPGSDSGRLTMIALDRRILDLIDRYRAAKLDHERQTAAQALVSSVGNYDLDDSGFSVDVEASSFREQRAGLALADATAGAERSSRTSRTSVH